LNERRYVAVVESEAADLRRYRRWLEEACYAGVFLDSGSELLSRNLTEFAAVCLDLHAKDASGLDVLREVRSRDATLPVVVLSEDRDLNAAVAAMRAGACDYLAKPVEKERFLHAVRNAVDDLSLALKNQASGDHADGHLVLRHLVGQSAVMRKLAVQVERVMNKDIVVAISGETGSGKELIARALHECGNRRSGPFVAINCAAIPASLQASELFGHERGAFTGAVTARRGAFEQAQDGTLFLDELGEMSLGAQASLLRTIQERTVRRVGSASEIPINVRLISATSKDLKSEVAAGRFREDLYYRLVVYPICIPPLRERIEDIPLLVGHFLRAHQEALTKRPVGIHPEALEALISYRWPGNVRELENVISRAMVACDGTEVRLEQLPPEIQTLVLPKIPQPLPQRADVTDEGGDVHPSEIVPLREIERRGILRALVATKGNVSWAARLLGVARATLYRRIAEEDIRVDRGPDEGPFVAPSTEDGNGSLK
jgi:DNA-binding NtrC family response regulator